MLSKGKTATNSEDLMKRSNFLFKKKRQKLHRRKKKTEFFDFVPVTFRVKVSTQ